MHKLICGDCLEYLRETDEEWTTIFADPPDNIGLGYDSYDDKQPDEQYVRLLHDWLNQCVYHAKTTWMSYNSKWTFEMGPIVKHILGRNCGDVEAKPCTQVFTFGQHNQHDLGNNHRPLVRLRWFDAPLLPDAIRVPSWRQENGDKRADPRGRVPGDAFDMQYPSPGDVLDFPRVTGNSSQRCNWHPTQLHEDLVARCIKLTTPPGGTVLDPFGGTGTTLRVCRKLGFPCTLIELDIGYCEKIAEENQMRLEPWGWSCDL
jgi:site-specific DNA-methyltransferase (adenine-specific)